MSLRQLLLCTELKFLEEELLSPFWLNKRLILLYKKNLQQMAPLRKHPGKPRKGLGCLKVWPRNSLWRAHRINTADKK